MRRGRPLADPAASASERDAPAGRPVARRRVRESRLVGPAERAVAPLRAGRPGKLGAAPQGLAAIRVAAALVFVAVLVIAVFADPYRHVADDAGITLRYAERLAEGKGFGYNDGEHVNGCSNPLYMLAQAGLLALGLAPHTAVHALAALGLAGTAGLLFLTFARFWSLGAACVAVAATLTVLNPFHELFDGLESPFVAFLAALLFRALHSPSRVFHGVALGLLVANKLDGGIAALAYSATYLARHRCLPWKAAWTALATAAPMLLFLLVATGSVLPNSMVTKLTWHAELHEPAPFWMHGLLMQGPFRWLYLAAWLSIPALALQRAERRWAVRAIQVWFVLHLAAYTWIDLGAPMLWYAIVPRVLAVVLSACLFHGVVSGLARRAPRPVVWPVHGLAAAAVVAALWVASDGVLARHLRSPRVPHGLPVFGSSDLARQAAGAWLRVHTSGTEWLSDYQGLPAFEYGGPYYDTALLNSRRDERRHDSCEYLLMGPSRAAARLKWRLGHLELVGTFLYDRHGERFDLYARPESEIGRKGLHHLVLPFRVVRRTHEGEERAGRFVESLELSTLDVVDLRVESPEPPVLMMEASAPDVPEGGVVRLSVSAGRDRVLWRGELRGGGPPARVRVAAPGPTADRQYAFTLRAAAGRQHDHAVLLEELLVRAGEPLKARDLRLSTARVRARVDYVADVGLPCGADER